MKIQLNLETEYNKTAPQCKIFSLKDEKILHLTSLLYYFAYDIKLSFLLQETNTYLYLINEGNHKGY